jgi:hypothetical protein
MHRSANRAAAACASSAPAAVSRAAASQNNDRADLEAASVPDVPSPSSVQSSSLTLLDWPHICRCEVAVTIVRRMLRLWMHFFA